MPGGVAFVAACAAGYVAGSFPSAYLAGRLVKGVDLRTVGSGNLGATNVYREIGAPAAIAVLAVDAAKGWLPVTYLPALFSASSDSVLPVAVGAAALIGHTKPVFLLWRGGGKGVATAAGVFLALSPAALAIATAVFAVAVAFTRYVSVGSVAAAAALPAAVAVTTGPRGPVFVSSLIVAAFVIWRHKTNMGRLREGREVRLGRPGGSR
jgi:glycerol-3-phosphate acyltransferase PlsY